LRTIGLMRTVVLVERCAQPDASGVVAKDRAVRIVYRKAISLRQQKGLFEWPKQRKEDARTGHALRDALSLPSINTGGSRAIR
jgi:hypothetical protein